MMTRQSSSAFTVLQGHTIQLDHFTEEEEDAQEWKITGLPYSFATQNYCSSPLTWNTTGLLLVETEDFAQLFFLYTSLQPEVEKVLKNVLL